jgi:hypothetical protein
MRRAKLHVTPFAEGWRVTTDDGRRASELFLDRDEAVSRAEGIARAWGDATLYVHGRGDDDSFRIDFETRAARSSRMSVPSSAG